jgi:hypothetical protein
MTGWLKLTDSQRKATIDEAEQFSGITAKAIAFFTIRFRERLRNFY